MNGESAANRGASPPRAPGPAANTATSVITSGVVHRLIVGLRGSKNEFDEKGRSPLLKRSDERVGRIDPPQRARRGPLLEDAPRERLEDPPPLRPPAPP